MVADETPLLTLVPFGTDPLTVGAHQILDHYAQHLPDLSNCQILLAEERAVAQMRAALLDAAEQRGYNALLGPEIERLEHWVARVASPSQTILSRPAQELVLAEVLRGATEIYADTDPWLLSDQLLSLFHELSRCAVPVDNELAAFRKTLQAGYGAHESIPSLEQEASILHTLWHAWRQQLEADRTLDQATAYQQQLQESLGQIGDQILWVIGFTALTPSELHWLTRLVSRKQVRLILHGSAAGSGYHPDAPLFELLRRLGLGNPQSACDNNAINALFNTLFTPSPENLKQRAADYASRYPQDPLGTKLRTLPAHDPEQEAQTVALQVRRWLLNDVSPIAIVTEDRRLARRVRALLEASQIELDDPGGWALSTTSAAALLERWLETVEEDFACAPLLDVLKSPFVSFSEREAHLERVRRLEQDVILHENITRGLDRYRHHLDSRSRRLPDWSEPVRLDLHQMLNKLNHASSPLLTVMQSAHPVSEIMDALKASLHELGAWEYYESDTAGQQLLQLLQELQQAANNSRVELSWTEFRDWLGRNLERATYRAPASACPVQLLTPQQSRLQRFAAIIVAGCNSSYLPGSPATETFFNQRVRTALGLPTWLETLGEKLHHFCRVIQSADRVLLTWHREKDGESVAVSPWLELLNTFHHNAYSNDLCDHSLAELVTREDARPATPDTAALPLLQTRPRPTLPVSLQLATWTAYTHQRLIDCPYRFFAGDALHLKPQDEIREALSKSDYGSLVHRIVQAFNSKVDNLPGPWSGLLDATHQYAALQLLEKISAIVFAEALKENFQARSWFGQWKNIMPEYLAWEIERRRSWSARKMEVTVEKSITANLRIKGRIDRIDTNAESISLIDLKTGHVPKPEDVLSGEAVQLPSYALMLDAPVSQLEYLELSRDTIKTITCAAGEALKGLLPAIEQRMVKLDGLLQQPTPLPAWGDPVVCNWCEFDGVCRRDMWLNEKGSDD
jgi:ATP-dependent helicase/nuclease subunit B